jgi:hypothetical protein
LHELEVPHSASEDSEETHDQQTQQGNPQSAFDRQQTAESGVP